MKRVFRWAAFAACLLSLVTGGAWAQRTVTVDQYSSVVRLRVGDTLRVRLLANAGPNYVWNIGENNASLLAHRDDDLTENGVTTMLFRAIAPGGERLSLLYQNPNLRGVRALDLFRILVVIEGGRSGKTVVVRTGDNNIPVTLTLGDTLEARLPVNAGTGYSWGVSFNDGVLLRPAGNVTNPPPSGLPGGRATQSLRFRTVGVGSGVLVLSLRRPGTMQNAGTFAVPVTVLAPAPPNPGNVLVVGDADNNSNVTLSVGETLVIRLSSNPTTGYDWNLADNPPPTLQLLGQPTFERGANGMMGAGGVKVYRFRVTGAGGGVLRLLYQRSWEKNLEAARKWQIFFEIPRPLVGRK